MISYFTKKFSGGEFYSFSIENIKLCKHIRGEISLDDDDALRYYCKTTDKVCCAEKFGFWQKLIGRAVLSVEAIQKCPSREELSDKL